MEKGEESESDFNLISVWVYQDECETLKTSLESAMAKHDKAKIINLDSYEMKRENKIGESEIMVSNRYFTVKHSVSYMKYAKITQIRSGGDALFLSIPLNILEKEKEEVYRIINKISKWRLTNFTIFISMDSFDKKNMEVKFGDKIGKYESTNDILDDYCDELIHDLTIHCMGLSIEVVSGYLSDISSIDPETRDREGISRLSEILAGSASFKAQDNKTERHKIPDSISGTDADVKSKNPPQNKTAITDNSTFPKTEDELIKLLSENIRELTEDVEKYTSGAEAPENSKEKYKYDENEGLANIFEKIDDIQRKIRNNGNNVDRERAFALFEALAETLGEDSDLDDGYSSSESSDES